MDTWVWVVVAVVVVAVVGLLVARGRGRGADHAPDEGATAEYASDAHAPGPALPPPTGAPVFPEADGVDDLVPEEERFASPSSAWDSSHDPDRVLDRDDHEDGVDGALVGDEHDPGDGSRTEPEPVAARATRPPRTRRERRDPPAAPPVRSADELDRLRRARDRADDVIAQHAADGADDADGPAQPA